MTISEWADQNRKLSPEASAESGQWYTARAEYQRAIMDEITNPATEQIVVMSSAQVGKTEILLNAIAYHMAVDKAPMLCLQPTLEMAQTFSKDRIAPMLRDTPALHGIVAPARARDSGNTTRQKSFAGGSLNIAGSNSPSSLASRSVRLVFADEVDRYPPSAGTEGDSISLAAKRMATFSNSKLILTSTPTVEGASRIETAYKASDQRKYFVECHDCGEWQTLEWQNVSWPDGKPDKAVYVCQECGSAWADADRLRAIRGGEWRAATPFDGIAGFYLNGLYSPWTPLASAAREFVEAKKLPETLRVFINTYLGETWSLDGGTQVDDLGLFDRREPYETPVPEGVVVVVAGADIQEDRIEVEVLGIGRDEENYSLSFNILYGDPTGLKIWNDLDDLLTQKLLHPNGVELPIRMTAIDTGFHTQQVYKFVKPREGRGVMAIKGVGGEGKPLLGRPSKNNIAKVRLWPVGSNTVKELLMARLRITEKGPGYCHFPDHYEQEYFKQLTAEKMVTRYHKGFPRREFVKTRTRNEALDCRCYAMAAFAALNANINRVADRFALRATALADEKVEEKTQPSRQLRRPAKRQANNFATSWKN